jgi:hypothetical protein
MAQWRLTGSNRAFSTVLPLCPSLSGFPRYPSHDARRVGRTASIRAIVTPGLDNSLAGPSPPGRPRAGAGLEA